MPLRSDVIVVGGGIAGLTAGIAAARAGAAVQVISATESSLRQSSGLVDVLGYPSRNGGPVADPYGAIATLPNTHPYQLLGERAVRDALALFDEVVGSAYAGSHTDANALIPTCGGAVKPTARYPATSADGPASDERDALLVGFEAIPDLDAPLLAARLASIDPPFAVRGVTIDFPGGFRTDAKRTRYAQALDDDELVQAGRGERPVRDALAEGISEYLDGEERVGLPAMLGVERPGAVQGALQDRLGAAVFEIPMGPPSIPGMRLAVLLEGGLERAGGRLHAGAPVVDYETRDGRIERVIVDRSGARVPYAAEQYILATGGFVGKGIFADREAVSERVFGCYVPHPTDRYDWFEEVAFGAHAFPRFGVRPDTSLRPLDPGGSPEYENLRAAGAVIGGFDFAAEKSGAGVSLATGMAAGRLAAGAGLSRV